MFQKFFQTLTVTGKTKSISVSTKSPLLMNEALNINFHHKKIICIFQNVTKDFEIIEKWYATIDDAGRKHL